MADHDWLKHQHDEYKLLSPQWSYTMEVYGADYLRDDRIAKYLHRREQGESGGQYKDRVKNIRPNLLFQNLIGKVTGQLEGAESQDVIHWAEGGLGDPADPATRAYQLVTNIDGKGTDLALWKRRIRRLLLIYERIYIMPERVNDAGGAVLWKVITPDAVVDWDDGANPEWMKVRHGITRQDGPRDTPKEIVQYTVYDTDGWERWEHPKDKDVSSATLESEGTYEFYAEPSPGSPRALSIFRVSLDFDYYLGYLLAMAAIDSFNKESELRNLFRQANTQKLIGKFESETQGDKVQDELGEGANYFEIGVEEDMFYLAPETAHASLAQQELDRTRKAYQEDAFQVYADQAAQKTATEIRSDNFEGREALLSLIALKSDEAIRQALLRTEQIEYPGQRAQWGQTRVERTGSFRPATPQEDADHDRKVFYGDMATVPLTVDAEMVFIKQQYEASGLPVPEEDELRVLAEAERRRRDLRERETDMLEGMLR